MREAKITSKEQIGKTYDRTTRSYGHHRITLIWDSKYLAHKLIWSHLLLKMHHQSRNCNWWDTEKFTCGSVPFKPSIYSTLLIIFLELQNGSLKLLTVLLQKHLSPNPYPEHSLFHDFMYIVSFSQIFFTFLLIGELLPIPQNILSLSYTPFWFHQANYSSPLYF